MTLGYALRLSMLAPGAAGLVGFLIAAGVLAAVLLGLIAPALSAPEFSPTRWVLYPSTA